MGAEEFDFGKLLSTAPSALAGFVTQPVDTMGSFSLKELGVGGRFRGREKSKPIRGAMNRYPQIVEHFVRIARANFGNVVRIDDLCRLAGANPRTISRAFKVVHDSTPSRYLRELRLMEVRRVLLSGCNRASITQVATRFGFRELGRFSVLYRNKFGEAPSVTNDLSISRHEPHDAAQGAGRVDFVDVDRPSKGRLATQTTNSKHPRQEGKF